ncbi:MAG: CBS domain-containing protein [Dongiaceae bacterium]
MKIKDIMSRDVRTVRPTDTAQQAAAIMAETDVGALPVAENDRLIGMITDRDIVIRAVAKGKGPSECCVRDVMSGELKYVYEDESTDDLARNMSELQVRRLPVMTRDKQLVGIVAMADLATAPGRSRETKKAITGVSEATTAH